MKSPHARKDGWRGGSCREGVKSEGCLEASGVTVVREAGDLTDAGIHSAATDCYLHAASGRL